ncbi:amidohydrolase [Virgibacillus halotolerans]|uniref:M20 metallopeptidase family protein n=1 Tax=Virgibacillus halotolerans TaxID=1071053 RepID=UPI001EF763E2|nr:amidohydrolase [Virgibacillus halotolerans]MBM7601264.1 amidohydrolase [Virgibacillus halotolerans]
MTIKTTLEELAEEAIENRRYLHQHPEVSGAEFETAVYIHKQLEGLGIQILDYKAPSVVGFVQGTSGKKTIALRADIDALPITEEGNKPYMSRNDGVMHACGHDGHTAILLAVAKWLVENKADIQPNVMLIFQSSEEQVPSGADLLVRQGILEDVDEIYGLHLWQPMAKGKIGLAHGPMMASTDDFDITIHGNGGHGSMPHDTVDPIYLSSHLIQAYQSIVSRQTNPTLPLVISIGNIAAGATYNIIPNTLTMKGTIRALDFAAPAIAREQMNKVTAGICESFGATWEINHIDGTPAVINDPSVSQFVENVIQQTFEKGTYEAVDPVMGGEDFGFYLREKPGAFIFVGMGGEKSAYPHHHPKFDIDEDVIRSAIKLFTEIVKSGGTPTDSI